ncbi:MAG: GYD domain-containing protein [Betaproteobacteria bacterium]|nr:GYD domain-containing protein [Betaproteobacteria bacterium]
MPTYIALANFTDQGIRGVKDSTKRADAVKDAAKKFGASMTQIYWTVGQYDLVTVIEAPNDESATAFALAIGSAGNVRTQTMRAFSRDEMNGILASSADRRVTVQPDGPRSSGMYQRHGWGNR